MMHTRIPYLSRLIGLTLALALVVAPIALAEITQVQMGVDGMI